LVFPLKAGNNVTDSPIVATAPANRYGHAYGTLSAYPTKFFFIGGRSATEDNSAWELDVLTLTFTHLAGTNSSGPAVFAGANPHPDGFLYCSMAAVNNETFVFGGQRGGDNTRFWLFHRPTRKFRFIGGNASAPDAMGWREGLVLTTYPYENTGNNVTLLVGGGAGALK
jgi:hypothetical protein